MRVLSRLLMVVGLLGMGVAQATSPAAITPRFDGAALMLTGEAELEISNDEAVASFYLEVQDAELAKAQSQLNQRVAEGVALLKRADPSALIETSGYSSYPVYPREGARKPVAWRARQSVTLRTRALSVLPKTVAAGQQVLALGGLDFRVSKAAAERAEAELIQRALESLNARVIAVAAAVRLPAQQIRTEELNFGAAPIDRPMMMSMTARKGAAEAVAEPQFDPGTSTQRMTVTARLRLPTP